MPPGVDQGQGSPAQAAVTSRPSSTPGQITVQCTCGKKLKAPASAVGKRAKCPGCGNVLTIPAVAAVAGAAKQTAPVGAAQPAAVGAAAKPATAPKRKPAALGPAGVAPAAPPPVNDQGVGLDQGDLDGLYALAASEQAASAQAQADDSIRCPGCFTAMEPGAVLCTNCGFDTRSNKQLSTRKEAAKKRPALFGSLASAGSGSRQPKDKMAPEGSFLVGLGCSAAGGVIGAILWYVIAYYTGYMISFVAMGVGALCGVGMQIGQKGYSKLGGFSAAGVTLLAILAANVALFSSFMSDGASKHSSGGGRSGVAQFDERVVTMLTNENLQAAGVEDPDDASEKQQDKAEADAVKRLKNCTKPEYDALLAKAIDKETRDELVDYVAQDLMKEQGKPNDVKDMLKQLSAAHQEAERRVEAMSAPQRTVALKEHRAKEAQDEQEAVASAKAERAKRQASSSSTDEDGGSSGGGGHARAVGIAFLIGFLFVAFGIKSILFVIIGMALAYKTAAGAVSG